MEWPETILCIVVMTGFFLFGGFVIWCIHRERVEQIRNPRSSDYSVPVPQWTQETTWTYTKDEPEEEDEGV